MFRKILVPVDLSDRSEAAVREAAELAEPSSGSITLLHVIETIQDVLPGELEDFYRRLRDKAEEALRSWATELAGLDVRREIVFGKRGLEIVRYAEEQQIDLIVLASHPFDPEHPHRGFGTVSHQVALLARCPVLLMR